MCFSQCIFFSPLGKHGRYQIPTLQKMHFWSGWAEADFLFCMILCKMWVGLVENTYLKKMKFLKIVVQFQVEQMTWSQNQLLNDVGNYSLYIIMKQKMIFFLYFL